jgi:RNA polymerase sigma-70 factor (ECF subfamily)
MARWKTEVEANDSKQDLQARQIDRTRIRSLVEAFVSDLPPRQREVFQLSELQGLSSQEVGTILGLAPGSVRAALLKARRSLRRRILEQHPEFVEEYLR